MVRLYLVSIFFKGCGSRDFSITTRETNFWKFYLLIQVTMSSFMPLCSCMRIFFFFFFFSKQDLHFYAVLRTSNHQVKLSKSLVNTINLSFLSLFFFFSSFACHD